MKVVVCSMLLSIGLCPLTNAQTGLIDTIAGNGTSGFTGDGGPAKRAALSYPGAIAVDPSGNLFIADSGNNRIRKISPAGIITTVVGNGTSGFSGDGGPAIGASINGPGGIAVDTAGNLLFVDAFNGRIRKITPSGIITTIVGNGVAGFAGDGGPALSAELEYPGGLAVDKAGNLYIADTGNNRVRKVSPAGTITTVAGNGQNPFSGTTVEGGPATKAFLNDPGAVATDAAGNLFIVDNFKVWKVSASGTIVTYAGGGNPATGIGDGGPATSAALSAPPGGIALDSSGNLFIADGWNFRVRMVNKAGVITTVVGNGAGGYDGGFAGDGGPATSAELSYTADVAVDNSGNLFIATNNDSRIRMVLARTSPVVISANNSADYSTTIAQGSLFVAFGGALGPAALSQISSFPLPNNQSGTSATVTFGTTTLSCPMIYTSAGQIAAILPSNTPAGPATVTIAYNAATGPYGVSTTPITVAASSAGIFTINSSGQGAGVFTAPDGSLKTSANSAKPGDIVIAWATGLGAITGADNVLPTAFPNFPGVQVWVGGQPAQIYYAGRSGCCAAVDQVAFYVPAVPNGCGVPVVIAGGGIPGNTVTLPVNSSGGTCTDSGPVLPPSVLTKAEAGQPVRVAAMGVGPGSLGLGQNPVAAQAADARAAAARLSAALHTPVSESDAARLLRAYRSKNQKAMRFAMEKYARQWKALDAKTKAQLTAEFGQTQEGAAAIFGSYSGAGADIIFGSSSLPYPGACTIVGLNPPSGGGTVSKGLDAGSSLFLSGPAGSVTMKAARYKQGDYSGSFKSAVIGPAVPPGTYTISGAGGADIGPFKASLAIGSNLSISNKSSLTTVDRTQPLTITWTGGVPGNYVLIAGYTSHAISADGTPLPNSAFACTGDAGKGSFTIPTYILYYMNATAPGKAILGITPHPLSNQISIPGLDLAYFLDASSDSLSVTFR